MALLTKSSPITDLDRVMVEYAKPDLISHDQFVTLTTALRAILVGLAEPAAPLAELDDIVARFGGDAVVSKMRFYTAYLDLRSMVALLTR